MHFIKEIFVEDNSFTSHSKRVFKFCRLLKKENIDIFWACNSRVGISKEVLQEIKNAGCRLLCVGFESRNQNILNNCKKGITLKQQDKFIKNCNEIGLDIHACFIFGLEGETKELPRAPNWKYVPGEGMIRIE